ATQTLLSTGHTVRYCGDRHPLTGSRRHPAYSTYNADKRTWQPWQILELPDRPEFAAAGAGSTQRYDSKDGTILLPVYLKPLSDNKKTCSASTVLRCAFNGTKLQYLEHGTEMTISDPRGFCEPSITFYNGRFYLTLRNDVRGYVSASNDGLNFDLPRPWRFDDGSELGNYNTQQHWVTHSDGLFLVYTRRGLNNDHVFRHRAPLMIAQVDPEDMTVMRETERELVPNRGARLGNFSVCDVTENETWVVVSEWMQPVGCEQYGSDNTIWAARILWSSPNRSLALRK
ncbi:MAG: exo-alpha-sialidase, partial [Kiritimatiellia bacterium]